MSKPNDPVPHPLAKDKPDLSVEIPDVASQPHPTGPADFPDLSEAIANPQLAGVDPAAQGDRTDEHKGKRPD